MKTSQLFVSLDDFSNRFKETFIYYKGVPKYVHSVTADNPGLPRTFQFRVRDLSFPPDDIDLINIDDDGVNFRQYNIGYTQSSKLKYLWGARNPFRQWKQGLRADQVQYVGHDDSMVSAMLACNQYTYNMLANIYPTVEGALEDTRRFTADNYNTRIAIHKNFALIGVRNFKHVGLEYKGMDMTSFNSEGVPKLNPEMRYLTNIPEYSKLLRWVLPND